MKIAYAIILAIGCLPYATLYASEQLRNPAHQPVAGEPAIARHRKSCMDRFPLFVSIVGVVLLARSALTELPNCAPADTDMTGSCWGTVRRGVSYVPVFDGPFCPQKDQTVESLRLSPEVQDLLHQYPKTPITCIQKLPCRRPCPQP